MEFAFGLLRISPSVFWSLTPIEYWASHDGFLRANTDKFTTSEQIEEAVRKFEEMKARFG